MNRQQARRITFKSKKAADAANRDSLAAAELAHLRATRRDHQLPKQHPGKLMSSRRSYAKKHGQMNRSIISDVRETIPAVTTKVGRKTVTLIPARTYDTMVHATKGVRVRRVYA